MTEAASNEKSNSVLSGRADGSDEQSTVAALFRFELPPAFWRDHLERCGAHPGIRNVIKDRGYGKSGNVIVDLDAEALADLKSDADYYGGSGAPDMPGLSGLHQSARATLRAIAKKEGRS